MTPGAALEGLWRRLASGGAGFRSQGMSVIAIRIVGAALGLAAQVLASRLIGAEEFGRYAIMLVWLLLLGHASSVGTNQLVCRYLAQYIDKTDPAGAAGLLRVALGLAGAVAITVALGAIALVRSGILGLDPAWVLLATLGLSVVPLLMLQDFLEAIARGMDRPNLGIAPAFMLRHLAIICGVVGLMAAGAGADAVTIMALTMGGLAASIAVQYVLLHRHVRALLGNARPRYQTMSWIRSALAMAVVDAAEVLFLNADILILGLFVAPEYVAFYFAATRLAQILAYVPYGISAVTAQKFAALAAPENRERLQALISSVSLTAGLAAAAVALVLTILAAPLLGLFGAGYDMAQPLVPLLCAGIVIGCALGPGEDVLTMLGQERICSAVFVAALAVNIGLNFALIPGLGVLGAAIATTAALTLRGALLAFFAYRRLGLILPISLPVLTRPQNRAMR